MANKSDKTNKNSNEPKRLYRLPKKGMIAGVAAGMAEYFNIDVTLMRVLFVVAVFITSGLGILAYLVMAIITPTPESKSKSDQDISENVNKLASEIKASGGSNQIRNWLGIGLVVLGVWLLMRMFWPGWFDINWRVVWPAALVMIGLIVLSRSRG